MRRATVLIIPIVCLGISALFTHALNVSDSATAAPIPKAGPITLEGTIEDLRWSPEEFRKGMAGMSGTLGQERTFPARYVVVLRDINILDGHGGYFYFVTFPQESNLVESGSEKVKVGPQKGRDKTERFVYCTRAWMSWRPTNNPAMAPAAVVRRLRYQESAVGPRRSFKALPISCALFTQGSAAFSSAEPAT